MVSDRTRNVLGSIGIFALLIVAIILTILNIRDRAMQMRQLQQMAECSCDMCHEKFDSGKSDKKISVEINICDECLKNIVEAGK